jgi:hypothetical protein
VRSRVRSLKKLASVYLVEEHGLRRKHLRLLLSKEPGFRVAETEPQSLQVRGRPFPTCSCYPTFTALRCLAA